MKTKEGRKRCGIFLTVHTKVTLLDLIGKYEPTMDKDDESTMHFLHLLQRSMAASPSTQQLQLEGKKQQQQDLFGRTIKRNNRFVTPGPSGGRPVSAAVLRRQQRTGSGWTSQPRAASAASYANHADNGKPCLANLLCQHEAKCGFWNAKITSAEGRQPPRVVYMRGLYPPDKDSPAREPSHSSTGPLIAEEAAT